MKKLSPRYAAYLARYRQEPPVKNWKPRGKQKKPRCRVLGVWVR